MAFINTKFGRSIQAFINKRRMRKASSASKDKSVTSSQELSVTSTPMFKAFTPSMQEDLDVLASIAAAFHDPSVLDVRRSSRYGLSSFRTDDSLVDIAIHSSKPNISSETLAVIKSPKIACGNSSVTTLVDSRVLKAEDFELLKLIGKGASGQVHCVRDKVTHGTFALKVVAKQKQTDMTLDALLKEQDTLRQLSNNPWFLTIEASWNDTNNFYMLMPMYPTDIDSELIRRMYLDHTRARFYMAEIIVALKALHKMGIIHRDIKPANVLIDREGHVVLADFGLSKNFKKLPGLPEVTYQPYWPWLPGDSVDTPHRDPQELPFVTNTPCGSPMECAPELYLGAHYSFGVDYWSAGATLYWMLTGRPPWYDDDDDELMRMIIEDDVEFEPRHNVEPDAQDFIRGMLCKSPEDRLKVGFDLEGHPFFAGLDWVLLEERKLPAPWIPEHETSHMVNEVVEQFEPGLPYLSKAGDSEEADPYPEFNFMSDKLKPQVTPLPPVPQAVSPAISLVEVEIDTSMAPVQEVSVVSDKTEVETQVASAQELSMVSGNTDDTVATEVSKVSKFKSLVFSLFKQKVRAPKGSVVDGDESFESPRLPDDYSFSTPELEVYHVDIPRFETIPLGDPVAVISMPRSAESASSLEGFQDQKPIVRVFSRFKTWFKRTRLSSDAASANISSSVH